MLDQHDMKQGVRIMSSSRFQCTPFVPIQVYYKNPFSISEIMTLKASSMTIELDKTWLLLQHTRTIYGLHIN